MKKHKSIFKKSAWDFLRAAILPVLFTVAVMVMVVFGLRQTEASSAAEGVRILEDSLRRAVVMSYAIEGRYPESLEYIEANFGVYIDRTRFVVHYRVFASNIMPEVMVIPLSISITNERNHVAANAMPDSHILVLQRGSMAL